MDLAQIVNSLINVHPWHTQMVHFPIALSTAGLLFVVLAALRRSKYLEHAAFFCLILVAISSVFAGATGVRDYIVRYEGGAPLGPIKMFLGASLFLLTTIAAFGRGWRRDALWYGGSAILYVSAYLGAFLLSAALGYLGGVIIFGF